MSDDEFSRRIADMTEVLYRVSYSQLAQEADRNDAVQETLYKAWSKRKKLKDERFMQTWVVRILINECHNIQRARKREEPLEYLQERIAPADSDYILHDALFRIGETLLTVVTLYYIEGFTTAEVAKILSIPQGTVKWRLMQARKRLKAILTEEDAVI